MSIFPGEKAWRNDPKAQAKPGKPVAVVESADEPVDDLDDKTLAELRELAEALDVPTWGSKAQIIERIRGA